MNDIVERLAAILSILPTKHRAVVREAATEIDRLREDNANLRKRINLWEPPLGMPDGTIAGANYSSNLDTTDDKKHTEKVKPPVVGMKTDGL